MISAEATELNKTFRRDLRDSGIFDQSLEEVRASWNEFGDSIPEYASDVMIEQVDADGVSAEWVVFPGAEDGKVILHFHGGAYAFGRPKTYRNFNSRLSEAAKTRILAVDYRLAPEHPFPSAIEDTLGAYKWVLSQGVEPANVGFVGESAGGGLVFATLLAARDQGVTLPGAAVAVSSWLDMEGSGPSYEFNREADPMIGPGALDKTAEQYLNGADPKSPLASPVHADVEGLPPLYLLVGSTEVLLDDSREMFSKLSSAGVNVTLEVAPEMPHIWPIFAYQIPEGRLAIRRMAQFFDEYLG